jgi:peptidoglycan/xylan/chitin deacetylase (PgdA/CDA1 family)
MTTPAAPLMFTFDDGNASVYSEAFSYMASKGIKGTAYIVTGSIGDAGKATAANLQAMFAAGWTIGNHSRDHTLLTGMTEAQQETAIQNAIDDLAAISITTGTHMAYPGGQYNADTLTAMAAKSMLTGRNSNTGSFFPPGAQYELQGSSIDTTVTLAQAKSLIDVAMNTGKALVMMFHDLTATPTQYDWTIADFQALVDYVVAQGYTTKTMAEFYNDWIA